MNPIARFFSRLTTYGRASVSSLFVSRTESGVAVSNDNAMQSDTVYAGIRYLAQTVGQLPWYAYKTRYSGSGADQLTTSQFDGVNAILNGRCNPAMNAARFREIMVTHAILYGNGVAEIERQGNGRAIAVYPLDPASLKFETNGKDVRFLYRDQLRGEIAFAQEDVFHLPNFGVHNEMAPIGKSVIEYAAQSIGWARATELFGAAYFQNGVHPSGLITMKNALSPEAYRLFEEALKRKFSGSKGAHQPFITDGEATFTRFGIQADEAQFIQAMQHQVEQQCRWIGVPPSKVMHLLHAGVRANVEHASIEVVQDAIQPIVNRFEQEANVKLFRPGERYFTRMDMSALLRGDMQTQAEYFSKLLDKGVLSVNEVRAELDYNPIGADGDQHLVQGQYMPLGDVSLLARTQSGGQKRPETAPKIEDRSGLHRMLRIEHKEDA